MRQQSSNVKFWLYAVLIVVLAAVLWGVSREIPFATETVEQSLENPLAQ